MKCTLKSMSATLLFSITTVAFAQSSHPIVEKMVDETYQNSQLEKLGYELIDKIGPRLVGSPKMQQAHDWAVNQFKSWGISAKNEPWGEWRSWERGTSQITLTQPYIKSLEGRQLAFSPATTKNGVEAELITMPVFKTKAEFDAFLKGVKGKIVMISPYEPSGRPDYNWKEYATEESYKKYKEESEKRNKEWAASMKTINYTTRTIQKPIEEAGAVGIVMSTWSGGFGVSRIFNATTSKIPVVDIALEDYGQLYRMVQYGDRPKINLNVQSKNHGTAKTFNTIAELPGTTHKDEYVILSAHIDSWDGASGAVDNGTGVITMMEVARILKKYYPNPKRTIIVGLWGSEEQGLNGSRAFVADNKDKLPKIQAVFNQDNGTGRIQYINGSGFVHAYNYLQKWIAPAPEYIKKELKYTFPGSASGGSSDHVSFVAAGVPAFMLGSLTWAYGTYTWHTNRDTYDKIVFDDLKHNVALIATMTYMASEDPEQSNREKMILPINPTTGKQYEWPEIKEPTRKGGF
ncbi:M20/M25/M40 family metallo-hydrolase [Riemerella anatipestifer]|uniref:M20/M25/M40 family metallo-hydrolase n=1 Tax=Riemerella anatipestifer TaxID=34085 RepID=UPI00129E3707|nr:M20/M25/M40 family metallo-hydrolase [Riemerella anatipestifer]MDY3318578.1 M20/M25/M40 family metallo-hydrolase [Riemerella anatipestifer]MDY3324847.1 M20/M25/M40 family metallo-hydrolase [Riemerella anatipestifer]MDY3353657.1 M20/M25/M40 family metallo-hydrolase [Riemerella anatipestifer]MRM83428.1 M20/M25/M40 family metallo-hydrolase [Riemerella anatipestifer]